MMNFAARAITQRRPASSDAAAALARDRLARHGGRRGAQRPCSHSVMVKFH
jgi:hypothetical protein